MKNILSISGIVLMVIVSGCGEVSSIDPTPPVGNAPNPSLPQTQQDQVNALVVSENQYREGLGGTALTNGLSCTLQTFTNGSYINSTNIVGNSQSPVLTGLKTIATFLLTEAFNQPNTLVSANLNVLPVALQEDPVYQNNILLTCTGQIVVTATDYYDFDILSDDGSVVYIDGAELIDNDGVHSARDVSGTKYLRLGVHSFTLKFFQGNGSQALVFSENGSVMNSMYFYH